MFLLKCNLSVLCVLICWSAVSNAIFYTVTQQDWDNYKSIFNKSYVNTAVSEAYARYYYNYNMGMIINHNAYFDRGQRTYSLKANQFTDMRLVTFNSLFPAVQQLAVSYDSPIPALQDAPPSFDPITMFNITVFVEDQGIACNSGWAYATAKAIELLQAQQMGNDAPARLSAQNLIDCAGRNNACRNQVPQMAFDYLTQFGQNLHLESDYPNDINSAEPNMCTPNATATTFANLGTYARILNGDTATLLKVVGAGYPVVVEFNPTSFDFMHYASGVFPAGSVNTQSQGAHHLIVLGFGNDPTTKLDYWLCLNSFGSTWGDMGYIKIARETSRTIFRSAIFPIY